MGAADKNTGTESLENADLAACVKEYGAAAGKQPTKLQIEDPCNIKGEAT